MFRMAKSGAEILKQTVPTVLNTGHPGIVIMISVLLTHVIPGFIPPTMSVKQILSKKIQTNCVTTEKTMTKTVTSTVPILSVQLFARQTQAKPVVMI